MESECERERLTGELDRVKLDHSSNTLQQLDTLRLTHTRYHPQTNTHQVSPLYRGDPKTLTVPSGH